MSKIWVTTDTHFGHDNMVQYCGRPTDFADKILAGFNVIQPEDIMYKLAEWRRSR